jgi:RNA polymerase sigma-70 factor, ECF subfamily
MALRQTRNTTIAQDIQADVFAVAWRRFDELARLDTAMQRAWLLRATRLIHLNADRRQRTARRTADLLRQKELSSVTIAFVSAAPSFDDAVQAALDLLKPADREVLELVAWEDLNGKQLATVLGVTHQAARLRLMRARRAFQVVHEGLADARPATSTQRRVSNG